MHLILAIVVALVIFRWVTTKPAPRRMSRPIEGTATIPRPDHRGSAGGQESRIGR